MPWQAQSLRDQTPLGVANRGAVIHDVLQHPGVSGAINGQHHLVPKGGDSVAEQLFGDRIGHGGYPITEVPKRQQSQGVLVQGLARVFALSVLALLTTCGPPPPSAEDPSAEQSVGMWVAVVSQRVLVHGYDAR